MSEQAKAPSPGPSPSSRALFANWATRRTCCRPCWPPDRDQYFLLDPEKRFRFASESGLRALGRHSHELLGRTWLEAGLPTGAVAEAGRRCDEVLATGESRTVEVVFPAASGERAYECQIEPVRDAAG